MDMVMSVIVGLGLAAACGFRVFVPMAVVAIGARAGMIDLGAGWEWLGSVPALVALSVASVVEIAGYWVPWVDHVLDTMATPAAVVAGTIVAASQMAQLDPMLKWSCAAVAGGGLAAVVQSGTVLLRAASTSISGGLTNPIVSTGETAMAGVLSLGALASPIVALVMIVLICVLMWRVVRVVMNRRWQRGAMAIA